MNDGAGRLRTSRGHLASLSGYIHLFFGIRRNSTSLTPLFGLFHAPRRSAPNRKPGGRNRRASGSNPNHIKSLAEDALGQHLQGFGFDLADAFPGQPQKFTDFFQGLRLGVVEAEAHPQDRRFAGVHLVQHAVDVL